MQDVHGLNEDLLKEALPDEDRVAGLHLVVELDVDVAHLAFDEAPHDDSAIRSALREAAGERNGLLHRHARVEDEGPRTLDVAIHVKALGCRHVDDVAVAQQHFAARPSELELTSVDANLLDVV